MLQLGICKIAVPLDVCSDCCARMQHARHSRTVLAIKDCMKQVFISHLNTVELQLSRIAKFEELRSMQLDQSSSAAAQKELLAGCQEAELHDLKELHSRQRILILNQFFHQKQREAKEKFYSAKNILNGSSVTAEHAHGNQGDETSVPAETAASEDIDDYVKRAMAAKAAQVAAHEEEEVKELKERHYTELAELVKSNESATKGPTASVKTVHVVSPDEHTRCEEATLHEGANSSYQTGITVENAPSTVVAEWQRRMRVGSCASILVSKEDGADAKAAAICKHLEKFVNAGPRKSVMDFKVEREQWKAKRDALQKWHPLFWCIVEEEAKHGSYEAFEYSASVVARGPTLCNIDRVIVSLEEGSFLRNMIANLGILGKAFNTLGAMPDYLTAESESSESGSSSPSSSSSQTEVPRQRRKVSIASAPSSHSSESSGSSDESRNEGSSSEESSSEDSSEGSGSNESSNTEEVGRHAQTQADRQSAMAALGKRNALPKDELIHETSSASSAESMESKNFQQAQPGWDRTGSASSEKPESSSSDDSDESSIGNSGSSSSASTSKTSSESGRNSIDETSGDSSEDVSSESSSSGSSGSNSAEKPDNETEESQTTSRSGNENGSVAIESSRASQPASAEAADVESSSSSSGSSSSSEIEFPEAIRSSDASQNSSSPRRSVDTLNGPRLQGRGTSPNESTGGSSGSSSTSRPSSPAGTETNSD
ncbi:hypothetical protein EAH_00041170 [Eimeria acervulina]|uniref:Uncharacterized protein n=1 Tax=Eimeria acervulina TaxID=5801 RepID=U6GWJ2_EIMAC|nr:hypothetical protein EAH_00041170 [Eimeria acervulina]CDI83628.1 hypothetical protein EAH_00041170 [Eimeria acervulina]